MIAATWPVLPSAGGGNLTLLTPGDGVIEFAAECVVECAAECVVECAAAGVAECVAECVAAGGPTGVGKAVVGNAESEMLCCVWLVVVLDTAVVAGL